MSKQIVRGVMAAALCLLVLTVALAAPEQYAISRWTVDGGGRASEEGDYTLAGTIGQPDVSPEMSGGEYSLVGGFWGGALPAPPANRVYLPLVVKQ